MLGRFIKRAMPVGVTRRYLNMHEYQSKSIMRDYGINVQKGEVATTAEDAGRIASGLSNKGGLILKAQVQAGGRGKGKLSSGLQGGVKICKTATEVQDYTRQMIGYNLVTHQTTAQGLPVNAVLVHQGVDIDKQIYLAIMLDRASGGFIMIGSQEGGVEIEEVAAKNPDAIIKQKIDIHKGLSSQEAHQFAGKLGFTGTTQTQAGEQLVKLYGLALELDATQVEINPWALTPEKDVYCVDAKINIDDNATFRQKKVVEMQKDSLATEDVDANEAAASDAGLSYIGLDGNIGCMVNGAGLAMATMDIIKLKGGQPANFLDVGGSANKDQVRLAFDILRQHENVKVILVNIFAGIASCEMIAQGLVDVLKEVGIKMPVVVRLTGNKSKEGLELVQKYCEQSGAAISVAKNLDEAATEAVKSLI